MARDTTLSTMKRDKKKITTIVHKITPTDLQYGNIPNVNIISVVYVQPYIIGSIID